MTGGTHTHRIIELLTERPGLDDDEIAKALGIDHNDRSTRFAGGLQQLANCDGNARRPARSSM